MMDKVDKATRSKIMASVGQRNTGPEMCLRKALHRLGLRYRLNDRRLPGSPDLVFRKYNAVIFVHGCFWHRHGCKLSTLPSTRKKFWRDKFEANKKRDKRNIDALLKEGWRVVIVWECIIKSKTHNTRPVISAIDRWLNSDSKFKEFGLRVNKKT